MAWQQRQAQEPKSRKLVAEVKVGRQRLRINIADFGNGDTYDVRFWYLDDDSGERRPGKGLSMPNKEAWADFVKAVATADRTIRPERYVKQGGEAATTDTAQPSNVVDVSGSGTSDEDEDEEED
jgi:hypothetical protein